MYRVIDTAMWTDPKFRQLTAEGKLLFIYLITNTHAHVSGIYYLPRVAISHETGITNNRLDTLCDTLSRLGMARFDRDKEIVWIVRMLLYQGKGEKIYRAAANHLRSLHNSFLVSNFLSAYPEVGEYHRDRVSKGYPAQAPVGYQEQEQEQEQEQNTPLPPKGDGAGEVEVPVCLDTPDFLSAWSEWIAYRRDRRLSCRPRTLQKQLAFLAALGSASAAVSAVEQSIRNGWQGLFEPRGPAVNGRPAADLFGGIRDFLAGGESGD